ncbi:MAG TPA: hypothetical protein VF937_04120 [Chloroflexota bacterium]
MGHGHWRVTWRVSNDTRDWLQLDDAWIPHGRFHASGHLPLSETIRPGASTEITCPVESSEPPGAVVDNAFLILRVRAGGRGWRLFARMRVAFDARSWPVPVVETVTAQSIQSEA